MNIDQQERRKELAKQLPPNLDQMTKAERAEFKREWSK